MRNLRLYNTDAAFKSHEQAAGGDGDKIVTIVPGVSMSKDIRKRYFNPHDNSILVYSLTEKNYVVSGTTLLVEGATRKVKAVDGINTTINLTPRAIEHYLPMKSYETVTLPGDTSVTFYYKLNTFHKCVYKTDNDNQTIKLYNYCPSSGLTAITIDGEKYDYSNKLFPSYNKQYTFETAGLHEVLFHYSAATFLSTSSFYSTPNLVSVDIAYGTSYLQGSVFRNCSMLSSVTVPNSVRSFGDYSFQYCTNLKNIDLPDSVTNLGGYCFQYSGIESIHLPKNFSYCGDGAFMDCTHLTGVTGKLPNRLPDNLFKNCNELKTIEEPSYNITYWSQPGCSRGNYVTLLGNGFYGFGTGCFENCYKLELSGLTVLPGLSGSQSYYSESSVAVTFGNNCFHNCYSISSLTITAIKQEVGNHKYNSSDDCIGSTAFTTNVRFGESAFAGCSGLTKIILPTYTTNLSANCFNGCSMLEEITCRRNSEPTITDTTFYGVKQNGTLRVSSGTWPTWMGTDQHYLGYYGWTLSLN